MIVLEELNTEFGNIKIMQSSYDGSLSYHQDGCLHSRINKNGVSTCGYVHVMCSLIKQSQAQRVVAVGCAGGTLATMLHRMKCEIVMVDINPYAFSLAKRYFQMPEDVDCVVDDGWSYLFNSDQCYDAIAIDAFSGDGTVPEQFTKEGFFQTIRKKLAPSGVMVMNVMVGHDLDMLADRIALNMEDSKIPTIIFDLPHRRDRNVIIAGGAVDGLEIASSNKPVGIRQELRGIIRRRAKRSIPRPSQTKS